MKSLLSIRNILFAIPLLLLLVALHYALPQVDVVRAVGVEIKRLDDSSGGGQNSTRDVYYIQMETLDGEPKVYRNEDNFFYLKFDSADLQAQIQSLSAEKETVALRHYGWRLTVLSAFPNAVKVWPVDDDYTHIPIFNIVVLLVLGALLFLIYRRASKAVSASRQALEDRRVEREAEREAAALESAQSASQKSSNSEQEKQKKQDELDEFLNSGPDKKN